MSDPEISHEVLDPAVAEGVRGFCAEERYEGGYFMLTGPHLVHVYEEPLEGIEQGALFTFNAGERPRVVMLVEKSGERLSLQIARVAPEKVVVYYKDLVFTDLENNYMNQVL